MTGPPRRSPLFPSTTLSRSRACLSPPPAGSRTRRGRGPRPPASPPPWTRGRSLTGPVRCASSRAGRASTSVAGSSGASRRCWCSRRGSAGPGGSRASRAPTSRGASSPPPRWPVGSRKEAIRPLDLVIPDQFVDATRRRVSSFFGDGIVAHVGMAEPVCPHLATALEKAARQTGATVHRGGTYICIEGPQFSTRAESRVYRAWGVDVIGMTNLPEAKLAREAELCYATLALATDYDACHEPHAAVSVEAVVQNLLKNVATAKDVLRGVIPTIAPPRRCECPRLLANAVITNPKAFPPKTRKRLALLLDRYFPPTGRRRG